MSTPRSLVEHLLDEKPVKMRDRVMKNADMVCPHCDEVIHEKGLGYKEGKHFHGKCGGWITLPPASPEAQRWLDSWGKVGESKGPDLDVLKKHEVKLTPEERQEVFDAGATWHMNGDKEASPGVHKAEVDGKTWYFCYTHRAYQTKSTLKASIKDFDFIESTS